MKIIEIRIQIVIVLLLLSINIFSQNVLNNTDNERDNELLLFPWAGGMDAIQFCDIDFNMDGKNDLLAFDRRGNRKICFVNNNQNNEIDYTYAPQYADLLPEFYDWVIFKDYNMDGKNDIFTYSPGYGSMMVYKNVSDNILKFELVVYPYLKTLLPGGYVNLFVTNADYPGIADIDNDGDLDILTFGVLGSFVDMHINQSMEKYGTPDSLDFKHSSYCWGHFAENDESNILYLDTCMPGGYNSKPVNNERHTGSTLLLHDFNNNGLTDMLLGDVDYPELFALYNNGTIDDAHITVIDTTFPNLENEINLFSMPVAAYTDVNNDNIKDLLISPFDPGIITSQNKNSSLLYVNSGTNTSPIFEFLQSDFLQSEMVDVGSGAHPVIYDWDGDGLDDLFIGNFGYYKYSYYINYFLHSVFTSQIAYYKNIGTITNPIFELINDNFAGLSSLQKTALFPAFADINNDGTTDMLVGNSDGKIIYVSNTNNNFEVITEEFLDIDVGDYSTPQLFDLDKNNSLDLVIGEKAGNINYYKNADNNANFTFITDSLGKINVTDYSVSWNGYSTPNFFTDNNENTGLLVGSEQGVIYYYNNIDDNLEGKFTESDIALLLDTVDINTDRGMRTSAAICNNYLDEKLEMIVGNYSGGLEYFNGGAPVWYDGFEEQVGLNPTVFPIPASNQVTISFNSFEKNVDVSLFNTMGVKIKSKIYNPISNSVIFNLDDVDNGVYLLVTNAGGELYSNKIIVVK